MRLTTTTATATALTLLSTLSDASPQGDRLGSKSITRAQTEALTSAIQEAHRTGVSVRSLLGDIFGGDDDQNAGYAPYNVTCPTDITWNRAADSIGSVEQEYLNTRAPLLQSAWQQRTSSLNLQNPGRTPVVAMSLSGGGYRAMVHGSGQAFLQNNTQGSAGDVLGLSTYVGGLSGGSWAISTWLANNGAQPDQLVRDVSSVFSFSPCLVDLSI
jgi:lysophospholipase